MSNLTTNQPKETDMTNQPALASNATRIKIGTEAFWFPDSTLADSWRWELDDNNIDYQTDTGLSYEYITVCPICGMADPGRACPICLAAMDCQVYRLSWINRHGFLTAADYATREDRDRQEAKLCNNLTKGVRRDVTVIYAAYNYRCDTCGRLVPETDGDCHTCNDRRWVPNNDQGIWP